MNENLQDSRRFAIYYRISSKIQDFDGQKHAVEQWIANLPEDRKPTSVRVFEDVVSGSRLAEDKRKGFQDLKAAVKAGEIDAVVVFRIDRLGRYAPTVIQAILEWLQAGVEFFPTEQPILQLTKDNPIKITVTALLAEISQLEREALISRIKSGLAAAKARGVKLGAKTKITPEKLEKARYFRSKGKSYKAIGRMLELSTGTVHRMLTDKSKAI